MSVKLSTAYRKLWKHRHRWRLCIEPDEFSRVQVRIRATWHVKGHAPHSSLRNEYTVWGHGLADAMNLMAAKLDGIEQALTKFEEGKAILKELKA